MEQSGFSFDSALDHIPESQIPPRAEHQRIHTASEDEAFVAQLRTVLPSLPDDIDLDAPLLAIGLEPQSIIHWHRARSMDALLGCPPGPFYQAYVVGEHPHGGKKLRYRRLPPKEPCPGFEEETCTVLTRGGVRCDRHLSMEEESLWNQP